MAEKIQYLKESQVSVWWHLVWTTATIAATGVSIFFGIKMELSSISATIDTHIKESSMIVSGYEKRAVRLEDDSENMKEELAEIHTQIALILQRIKLN